LQSRTVSTDVYKHLCESAYEKHAEFETLLLLSFKSSFFLFFFFRYPFIVDQKVTEPDWQVYIRNTASMMVSEQSPKVLLEIRNRFYDLLTRSIPCDLIFRGLLKECIKNCDDQLKKEIIEVASEYQHKMIRGSKPIFHLEAFAARFMTIYKKYIELSLDSFI